MLILLEWECSDMLAGANLWPGHHPDQTFTVVHCESMTAPYVPLLWSDISVCSCCHVQGVKAEGAPLPRGPKPADEDLPSHTVMSSEYCSMGSDS